MTAKTAPRRNLTFAIVLAGIAVGMVGLSFAAVPLYNLFCQVTGYGGTTQRAEAASGEVLDQLVTVRFDANTSGLSWQFRPEVPQVHVRLGETAVVNFVAENRGSAPSTGTATFNVQPGAAGSYFNKIECFCFTEQELASGESIEMPVQFFVSPDMLDDKELHSTRTITLSYTFFPARQEGQPVAQTDRDGAGERL